MKKVIIYFFSLFVSVVASADNNVKRPESYNYQRGLEAYQNEKYDEAVDYFNKEIAENPKNGYAYSWLAHILLYREEYGRALNASDMSIKYLPKKDPEYVIFGYSTRAACYLNLGDTIKALSDYSAAIKSKPDESDLYEKRAQVYFELHKFEDSNSDYKKMIEIEPGGVMGYMGLGRNELRQGNVDDAIVNFNYAIKLDNNYSSGYAFKAEAEMEKKMWNEATNDLIAAMQRDWDKKAVLHIMDLKDPAFTMMVSKLKIEAAKNPNESKWPYLAGMMHEQSKNFSKAVGLYIDANSKDASPVIYRRISDCYNQLGEFEKALEQIELAINMDSTDLSNAVRKANILYEKGDVIPAITEWDKILAVQPEYAYGYYQRGWYKYLNRDYDNALDDFSMCIVLDPDESYALVCRGDIYSHQGKKELAEADFKRVIEIENEPSKYQCVHYAYQGLGLYNKAIEAIDSLIARDEDRAGTYYDASCLYGRMGNKEKAIEYLEKSLELGYNRFAHIERDQDMDIIRNTQEYKSLIQKYRKNDSQSISNTVGNTHSNHHSVVEIPFTKESGVCKVKCNINGLPLHFIFDTGASDVTLSMVEASFMMKNGYLSERDVIGSQRYMDANGNVSVGTTINLKKVDFGGLKLTNVRASVVKNQIAPLLLGQSVLNRLGKIEIDNANNLLKITQIR